MIHLPPPGAAGFHPSRRVPANESIPWFEIAVVGLLIFGLEIICIVVGIGLAGVIR